MYNYMGVSPKFRPHRWLAFYGAEMGTPVVTEAAKCLRLSFFHCIFEQLYARFHNSKPIVMPLVIPRREIKDFDDYRNWLCKSGQRYYEEAWSFKNKETVLQEYLAVCYAKRIRPRLNTEDALTIARLCRKN